MVPSSGKIAKSCQKTSCSQCIFVRRQKPNTVKNAHI